MFMRGVRLIPVALAVSALIAWAAPALGDEVPSHFDLSWGEPPARIGVEVQPMTPELRGYFKAPANRGVLVVTVEEGAPAAVAGLRVGDVIISAAGEPVSTPRDLRHAVGTSEPGKELSVEIVRDGEAMTRVVTPVAATRRALPWDFDEFTHRGRRELERHIEALEDRLRDLERKFRRGLEEYLQSPRKI
jgi:C-terminal processing protease CtpA/Prc